MVLFKWENQLEDTQQIGDLWSISVFPSSPHLTLALRMLLCQHLHLLAYKAPQTWPPTTVQFFFPLHFCPEPVLWPNLKLKTTIRMQLSTSRSSHILSPRPRWNCPIPLLSTTTFHQGSSYPPLINQPAFYTCRFRKKLENSYVNREVRILALPALFLRDGLYFSHYFISGL